MLEVKEVFLIILVSLTATISKILFAHFNKCCRSSRFLSMNKHLCGIGITIYFFQEILEFEVGQYHSN